jgi:signal transduction histidine kinase
MVFLTMVTVREVVRRTIQYEFDRGLTESAVEIGLAVRQFYPDHRDRLITALENKVQGHADRSWFVQLFEQDGDMIWASDNVPPGFKNAVRAAGRSLADAGDYRVIEARATDHGGVPLFVRCGGSRLPLDEDMDLVDRIMFLTGLLTLLLAPLGGFALANRATRPITQIISTASRLQPTMLDERLPIRGTGDELDQLSQTINGLLDRLASYVARNREFVANAAHELRSPLAAIRSTVEVGLNRGRTPEEYGQLLGDVMEECGRLANLVNRLLLLAEGDAGRLVGREQTARLDKIVRESVDMFDGVAESQGVTIRLADLRGVVVPGDEHHLRQVVRNLIDNAIKYSTPPGIVTVEVGTDRDGRRAFFSVQDRGIGIPPEDVPLIFERFYRVDKARTRETRRGGHGLGLSICHAIISALRGEIVVESRVGHGSKFTVWLPLVAGIPLAGAPPAGPPPVETPSQPIA